MNVAIQKCWRQTARARYTTADRWCIVRPRLQDISTSDTLKQVHYDLPHEWNVGDATSQRWGYLGKVTVTP